MPDATGKRDPWIPKCGRPSAANLDTKGRRLRRCMWGGDGAVKNDMSEAAGPLSFGDHFSDKEAGADFQGMLLLPQ